MVVLGYKSSLSDPDVPYGFFGIYVSDKIGLDLGTYYSQKDGEWGFDISGYIKNSAGEYAHYWRPSSIKYQITMENFQLCRKSIRQ